MSTALVYVTDLNFLGPTLVSAQSFAGKSDGAEITVFVTDAPDLIVRDVQAWLGNKGSAIQVRSVEMTIGSNFKTLGHLTPTSFGRLQMHLWLRDDYERVIYLDGDTLAGPETLDFGIALAGKTLGAVDDLSIVEHDRAGALRSDLGLSPCGRYFNSGVLVIDWAKWLNDEIGDRAIRYLEQNPDLAFGDQCALNRVCDEKWYPLDVSWNCQTPVMGLAHIRRSSRVVHFTGGRKPWHLDKWRGQSSYSAIYRDSLNELPVPSILRADTFKSKCSRILRPIGRSLSMKREFDWIGWLDRTGMLPVT